MKENRDNKESYEMSDSEISMRKFLKQLGVTTHQKLEEKIEELIKTKKISKNQKLDLQATINIPVLEFSHSISTTIFTPKN